MKYLVWELISPYDGYHTTECATWEEAAACVKAVVDQHRRSIKTQNQYKKWLAGKVAKVEVDNPLIEVFITSTPLTEPLT